MGITNIFPCVYRCSEEHGNEHSLTRSEVRHISSFKKVPQVLILQDSVIEALRGSLDGSRSAYKLK